MIHCDANAAAWEQFRRCRALAALSPLAQREVFEAAEERRFDAGEALITQGDAADGLLILLDGSAHAVVHDAAGREHFLGRFVGGDVAGEMALVTREPRTASVIADTPVRALLVPTATFDRLAVRHLELAVALTALVADRLGQNATDAFGGKRIEGYRIIDCVGRGGMSVVYRAQEEATGELVALKMMSYRLIYDSLALARFQQEADILQTLQHENIARLKRLFPAYHTYFLVLELCDGIDLQKLVAARGPLTEAQVRAILGHLAAALEYVHGLGVVHRDLKPANVMLTREGRIKLTDFGIALSAAAPDGETRAVDPSLLGTPGFMAPEQLAGGVIDSRTDIYALACLAFELLTGRHLFAATNFFELVQEKTTLRLPPASEIGGVSAELYDFMQSALRTDPNERPPSLAPLAGWAADVDIEM